MNKSLLIFVTLITLLSAQTDVSAQSSRMFRELGEAVFKSTGKESLEELAELGGITGTKDILERAVRQGGEALGGKVVVYTQRFGVDALVVVSEDPRMMVAALDSVSRDIALKAITEGARNPQLLTKLVRQHGKEVLEVSAKHPGVGLRVVDTYGEAGLRLANNLQTDDVILLARQSKAFNKLPPSSQTMFKEVLLDHPKTVLFYLAGVTGVVLTADSVLDIKDLVVGTLDETGPILKPIMLWAWIGGGVIVFLPLLYFSPKIWGSFQREKIKTAKAGMKLSGEAKNRDSISAKRDV